MSGRCATRPGSNLPSRTIAELTAELGERPAGDAKAFDMRRLEWFDLRNMLLVARVVAEAALARRESRGAHQREDFPRYALRNGGGGASIRVAGDRRATAPR